MSDFDEITKDLVIEVPQDIVDVSKMSIYDLLSEYDDLNIELFNMGEAINPVTQKARDLHSKRNAIQVELKKRGK
jgi:hypothetical protein